MKSVAVMGVGMVGGAMLAMLQSSEIEVYAYDKYKPEYDQLEECLKTDVMFVCVPSLSNSDGTQQLGPLENVLSLLKERDYKGVICVKSTLAPGTTQAMADKFNLSRVCHSPEFLRELTALEDLMNQKSILISGQPQDTREIAQVFQECGFLCPIFQYRDIRMTELQKYFHNVFLSEKVGIANDFYDVCEKLGLDYNQMKQGAISCGGIGEGHTKVPGHHGVGFSGSCFVKDTIAFQKFCNDIGVKVEILDAAIEANKRRRPQDYK